jgi:hypothetical protein
VKAEMNSLKNALEEAKENGIHVIFLENGEHTFDHKDDDGKDCNYLVIDFPVTIIGESKDGCIIIGGLVMKGKKEDDVNVKHLTISQSKSYGVEGNEDMSFHLFHLNIEKSGWCGVFVSETKRNTMSNCQVSHSYYSGVRVHTGLITMNGSGTSVHNNVTGGDTYYYGLHTFSSSSIHLVSPLTKESVSINNGGGKNYGGGGTIKTITKEQAEAQGIPTLKEKEDPMKFACGWCETEMCRCCRDLRTLGSVSWHEGLSCTKALLKAKAMVRDNQDQDQNQAFIEATTMPCPKCNTRVTRWHGHECHHIGFTTNGCPYCKIDWCYACGTAGESNGCGSTPPCSVFCSETDISKFIDSSNGWPKDNRCGCQICPDCKVGAPCALCRGNCVVCKGLVQPGKRCGVLLDEMPSTGETKESSSVCTNGALRVKPGLNSLKNALKKAKENGIKEIFLENGVHDEQSEYVVIDFPVTIIGESKDGCIIIGGLRMKGKKEDDVNVKNLTISQSKGQGVYGDKGMSFHLFHLNIEKSGWSGVYVHSTKRSTMSNCQVSHSKWSGVKVNDGLITINGSGTSIHNNGTDGNSSEYGLSTSSSSSSIHLVSPLTKESVSINNGGGGNWGGRGDIKTID